MKKKKSLENNLVCQLLPSRSFLRPDAVEWGGHSWQTIVCLFVCKRQGAGLKINRNYLKKLQYNCIVMRLEQIYTHRDFETKECV